MSYTRKAHRAANAVNDPRYAAAIRIATTAMLGPQYRTVEEGGFEYRVRVWEQGDPDAFDCDVQAWLSGCRVVDLIEGLEFLRDAYVKTLVRQGYLRKDAVGSFYWVTKQAAKRFKLPKVLGCEFPE